MAENWMLADAEELSAESPDSFSIPSKEDRENLAEGDYAKLIFRYTHLDKNKDSKEPSGERMWVKISRKTADGYEGLLDNDPQVVTSLSAGDQIMFDAKHIIDFQH